MAIVIKVKIVWAFLSICKRDVTICLIRAARQDARSRKVLTQRTGRFNFWHATRRTLFFFLAKTCETIGARCSAARLVCERACKSTAWGRGCCSEVLPPFMIDIIFLISSLWKQHETTITTFFISVNMIMRQTASASNI